MNDLSPVERRLFDWLSRWPDFFLIVLPFALFLGLGLFGTLLVSAIAGRSPLGDSYVSSLVAVLGIAAMVLYWATIFVMAVALLRTRRFRLLELHQTMRDIQAMSWRDFEDLVAAFYQAKGYAIEPRGGDRPDGGIDLIIRKGHQNWLVQCKHRRNQLIDVRALRELLGVVAAQGATGGILVACGAFDERALEFAKGSEKLELIGGEQLRDLVAEAVRSKHPETKCPKCGSPVRQKTGRFGAFLGCRNFPACHGWLPIPSGARPT